jgi:diaminopimelate epimerase
MKLKILKCHGSSNDFVLIDETLEAQTSLDDLQRVNLTQTICHRHAGIGADGVLFYQSSAMADCKMRMFNPDGGEAEMCGNGLRCIGRYAAERLARNRVTVETMKAVLSVAQGEPVYHGIKTFEAEIGPVSMRPASLPMLVESDDFKHTMIPQLSSELTFTALSVPNPHIVAMVDTVDVSMLEECGVHANKLPLFPNGVNVSFVKNLGANRIFAVTYERGVGITNSCGTAMSASAYVASLSGLSEIGETISVYNKGGMVKCDVKMEPGTNILLKGNATFVYDTEIEIQDDGKEILQKSTVITRTDEVNAYQALQAHAKSVLETQSFFPV